MYLEGLTNTIKTGRDQMQPMVPQPIVMTLGFPSVPLLTSNSPSSRIRWIVWAKKSVNRTCTLFTSVSPRR